jgi:hypothetical protein
MAELYKRYDDSKWTVPLASRTTKDMLVTYIQEALLPFPQSIHFKQDPNNTQLLLYAESMRPMVTRTATSMNLFYHMLADISAQIAFYEARGYTYVGFNPQDIVEVCIKKGEPEPSCIMHKYVILSKEYVCKINPHNKKEAQIVFCSGAGPRFCSPEIRCKVANQLFPIKVHVNAGYFGFGKYMEHILTKSENKRKKDEKKNKPNKRSAKLDGFLQRCFDPDESARRLLYL